MTRVSMAWNAWLSFSCGVALLGCTVAVEDGGEEIATEEEAVVFPEANLSPDAGVIWWQTYADIQLTGRMRIHDYSATESTVLLDVRNFGNSVAFGGTGRVYTSNVVRYGSLRSSGGAVVLYPGETGVVEVRIPKERARQCTKHAVQIDLDHVWQYDSQNGTAIFANDSQQLDAPCLSWTSIITKDTLGSTPDPLVDGKSLSWIVGSYAEGSSLGYCSSCHYRNTPQKTAYSPNDLNYMGAATIYPTQVIDDWRWAGRGGWAVRFLYAKNKPEGLKQVFRKWIDNGFPL